MTNIVFFVALATMATDFDGLVFGWHTHLSNVGLSVAEERGVKAAVLAMCAAASLFVGLIPMESGGIGRKVQLYTQIVGGFSALAAGRFWLLSEAGEHTGSYLLALVPMIVMLAVAMAVNMYLSWVGIRDDQQEEPKFRWLDFPGGICLLLLISLIIFLMPRLHSIIS